MLMKALDDSRTKGTKSKIDPSSFIDKSIKEPLHQMWEGSKTGHLPLIGDQVGVLFGNGKFLGKVLRIVSGDDSGGGEMLFDVGFSGEHVEINVPLSRLTSPLSMNAASNNSSGGGGGSKQPTEGKNGHLRVVCLSLNMSHQPLQTTNDGVSDGGGGGGGGGEENDHGFSMWVCDDGVFEAVAVDDLHEQADIVVLSLQDVPTSKC
jgi:hypothetical protein